MSIVGESMEANCSIMGNIPPKRMSFSDFICTFALFITGFAALFRDDVSAEEQLGNMDRVIETWELVPCIDYEKDGFTEAGAKSRVKTLKKLVEFLKSVTIQR